MPALTGPLFSLSARKSLRKTLTYSRWRGIQYVRSHVVPANPDTVAQQEVRQTFRNLNLIWNYMPTIAREPWTARATGQPFTDRNVFFKQNLPVLYSETDLVNFIGSPGSGGAPPPASINAVAGNNIITVDVVAPSLPTGWTIAAAQVMAVMDFDPQSQQTGANVAAGQDATSAYQVVLSGLLEFPYEVRGWLKWTRPDGSFAYSVALADQATPT